MACATHRISSLVFLLASAAAQPAYAQRTDDNAVTQAEDAFGKSVGDESIGIYNEYDVRGFSPVDAGNVRIEGLYFDRQAFLTDRVKDSSTIRVGISAQSYPFPAPTGIADYALRDVGEKNVTSIGLNYGSLGGWSAEVDTQIRLAGDKLGLAAGAGTYHETNVNGTTAVVSVAGATLRIKPTEDWEIIPFWSYMKLRDEENGPIIFTAGDFLPKRIKRGQFHGQKWADFSANLGNHGVVTRGNVAGVKAEFGLFRSWIDVKEDHYDLLFDVDQAGQIGRRVVYADGNNRFASTSGEFRLTKGFTEGARHHSLILSAKGRILNRRFGDSVALEILNPGLIGEQDFRPEPTIPFGNGPKTTDRVKQRTFGIGYQLKWKKRGELSLGAQQTSYRKSGFARDNHWLMSANGALHLSQSLVVYGGYARGLEEAPVAPNDAINRNEAPPAISTSQKDAGVRIGLTDKLTLITGVFDISKPYFNLDATDRFRQLGQQRNRGVEISLSGEIAKGLTVVAGNVFIDQQVSGAPAGAGITGKRPIGATTRHTIASVDYKVAAVEGLSLGLAMEGTSKRTANAANTLFIPTRAVFDLSARYRFAIDGAKLMLRAGANNIFNTYGFGVGGSGFYVTNGPRRFSLSLSADI